MSIWRTKEIGEHAKILHDHQEGSEPDNTQVWSSIHGPLDDDRVNFFNDGKTQIDYVLVWETKKDRENSSLAEKRQKYLNFLKKHGLLMEEHLFQKKDLTLHFMLLSAPWDVLCRHAEDMYMKSPIQVCLQQQENKMPRLFYQNVPRQPIETFNCHFKSRKLKRFLGHENWDTFFSNTQRHQIVYQILANAPYGSTHRGEVGVERLLREDVFIAAYPLHDGEYTHAPDTAPKNLLHRQILYTFWAHWTKWYKPQPLDHIRKYFGEKIALYFAWLGAYTSWLLPASVVGTIIFMLGIYIVMNDIPTNQYGLLKEMFLQPLSTYSLVTCRAAVEVRMEVCESDNLYQMCPVCKICPYWNLSSICGLYKAGMLFDNLGTLLFSFFMSIWSVTFLEYWKRSSATLVYRWDCLDFSEIEEPARPEFTVMAPHTIQNPITGLEEPYFPKTKRLHRIFTGSMVIILMIAVVIVFLISVILYRLIIFLVVARSGMIYTSASLIASITGSVLNLIIILMLSKVYKSLAQFLTQWEMHRTQTAYEDAFAVKVFIFEFVNYYSTPVYIAFLKGRFVGYPGHDITIFHIRNEDCNPGGCLVELAQQMLIIMVGKQILNNVKECVVPKLVLWWQSIGFNPDKKHERDKENPWERDYMLVAYGGLFEEYLEMVIQFGFITIFVAACPLAPLFALFNNWIEIRLDAQKFVCEYRRPVAERARGIGIWMSILEAITCIAVIGNAFLVAFTSDFLPRMYYEYKTEGNLTGYINFSLAEAPDVYVRNHSSCRYQALRDPKGNLTLDFWILLAIRLGFIIVFEHTVFFLARLIDLLIPDVPESIEIKVKRERFLAKYALAENEVLAWRMEEEFARKRSSDDMQSEQAASPIRDSTSKATPKSPSTFQTYNTFPP